MSFIAEFQLTGSALPLTGPLEKAPRTTVTLEQVMAPDPTEPVLFLWAEGDDVDDFDQAIRSDPTLLGVKCL
ncbi:MAG: helix-turn-helix domain-containing protein, partial [Halobacteriaceae archaeon]